MSTKHPIISVTGSSGAGTSTVKHTFTQIFRREGVSAVSIEGDAFHRYDRVGMKEAMAAAATDGNTPLQPLSDRKPISSRSWRRSLSNTVKAVQGTHPPLRPR